ncbi:MAG: LLM class flavin-dependent oxidoreductase, partial [Rhodospirillaceae bacterium]|nr:LLM class flavin-dependent oxidoreductase [Rhodospirillaceae bacterium]
MQYTFFIRAQYPKDADMVARFADLAAEARLADQLGFTGICAGMHYAAHPLQMLQQIPFLCRLAAEAPNCRMIPGIVLLSLHKPLDIAEQLATIDILSNGRLIFGVGIGYREVEFKAFGTTMKERGKRTTEALIAIKRLW